MLKKIGIAALAALTVSGAVLSTTTAADARGFSHGGGFRGGFHGGGYHGGGWRGGRGFGIGAGIATGLALGGAYGAYGYPGYAYGGYGYDDCYLQRRVVINRFGQRIVRPVRVCG